jgi:hypothetical protein
VNNGKAGRRHKLIERLRSAVSPIRATLTAQKTGRNFFLGGLAALALLATTGTAAKAQYSPDVIRPNQFDIRVGTYIPSEEDGRDLGGTYMWSFALDYRIQRLPQYNSYSIVTVQYIERNNLRIIPLTIGQVWQTLGNPQFVGRRYFYGIGGGLYQVRASGPEVSGTNKILPGGYLNAGVDITEQFFFEGRYHYMARYDTKFIGGLELSAGYRF